MSRILFVGDAAVSSGFARGTHAMVEGLDHRYGGRHHVTVLGVNHTGDPHGKLYDILPAAPGGDPFGVGRITWAAEYCKPDLIVIQSDPWNFGFYLDELERKGPKYDGRWAGVPLVGVVAVDGLNCAGAALNRLACAVFWTRFGEAEAVKGGFTGRTAVVPLGVDLEAYRPMDRREAREELGILEHVGDAFIVGNVNRNQPRKRWDLTIRYFANWVWSGRAPEGARLFLHLAPTGDTCIDVYGLAKYYGVAQRVMLRTPPERHGVSDDGMRATYCCFDAQMTTTQGEGFGLTTLEGMACGVPQVFPDWAALGEWAAPAGLPVPCTSTAVGSPFVNVIGGVADEEAFVDALARAAEPAEAARLRAAGLALAARPEHRWAQVGRSFADVIEAELAMPRAEFAVGAAEAMARR
jgi:D-inositol-3-phosphate glycosyltransferase